MSSDIKLSDRITNSAKYLLGQHLEHPFVSRVLLNGEDDNAESAIIHMWKNFYDLRESFLLLLESGLKKTITSEEKCVYSQLLERINIKIKRKDKEFREKFGTLDENLLCSLVNRNVWLFSQHLMKEASYGSMLEMLIITYTIIWVKVESQKLRYHSKFKPNPYFDFWCGDADFNYLANTLKFLIDSRGSMISTKEETHLIALVMKTIAFSHLCFMDVWNKQQQSTKF